MTFVYVKVFDYPRVDWIVNDIVSSSSTSKPLAVIMNTGAWSFDAIARANRGSEAPEYCDDGDPDTRYLPFPF